ncbi:TetR family transcriptional regulator [Paraburkholderia sp. RAU2J]|uniref:TetR/AcrR family transcriptional regulator n=1 Tax=unclassified Paraburkholderia TaxID=2615204 RepID=UPI000EB03928|nr:TetR/AcrR family transcriptional regulator [Paraburkholderia sp. RAU2J]RKT26973.1 TetR family transcriptional regulator [Paraburkholderia sp. RAU2J]
MARTIAFDYDRALERATWLFWKSGYAGTSLRDLLKIMDIGEGSFYNTLKSKKQLYLACVRRYEETEGRKRGQALMSAPTASRGIHALFGVVLDCLDNPSTPSRLCMMAAMASEEVLSEPELRKLVEDGLGSFHARLVERLSQDRDEGRLPATLDPHVTASVVVTYLQGIWRMALVDYDRPRFERQIDAFLTGLGL